MTAHVESTTGGRANPRTDGGPAARPPTRRATWWLVVPVPALLVLGGNEVSGFLIGLQLVQVLCLLTVGACAFAALLEWAGRDRARAAPGILVPLGLLFIGVTIATAVLGVSPRTFASVSITTVLAVAFALCVQFAVRSRRQAEDLVLVFIIGASLVLIPALQQTGEVGSRLGGAVVTNRPVGRLADPNELGALSAIVIVLSLAVLSGGRTRVHRTIALAAVVLALGTLLVSFSRTSWIAAGLGVAVLLLRREVRRRWWRTLLPVLLAVFVALRLLGVELPLSVGADRLANLGALQANPADVRPLIWRSAIDFTWERPLIGWGPGTFSQVVASPPSSLWAYPVRHAHSGPLTILVESGVVGLAVITLFVGVLLSSLVRLHVQTRRRTTDAGPWLPLALLACLTTIGAGLFADYTLRSPLIHVCVWFVAGLGMAVIRVGRTPTTGPAGER